MIALASLMDDSAFPWSTDWYRQRAEAAQQGDLDRNFRVWYTDNADHGDPPDTAAQAITVGYDGVVQQALATWPPGSNRECLPLTAPTTRSLILRSRCPPAPKSVRVFSRSSP